MHDFFNLLAVAIMLPLELLTGFLSKSAAALTRLLAGRETLAGAAPGGSPLKDAIKAPVALIEGWFESAGAESGLLGALLLVSGLALIFLALALITRNMKLVMAGRIEASMNTILSKGGGLSAMLVGVVITIAVQSSSITTSVLIPMVAAGVLTLRNAYPVTLGANIGTTVTALLASLAAERPEALTIALTHTLFNIAGILVFYPIPALRYIPVRLARGLADLAVSRKSLVFAYVFGVFVVLPLVGILVLR